MAKADLFLLLYHRAKARCKNSFYGKSP